MIKKLMTIILVALFLSGCNSSYDITEINDVMNFYHGEIRFTKKTENSAEDIVINELINQFGKRESAFEDINVIDIRSYFTIEDLKSDELDIYKVEELEEIFNQRKDSAIVFILYDCKLSNTSKIETLGVFYEGLMAEYFVLSKVGKDYEIADGSFKQYVPMANE